MLVVPLVMRRPPKPSTPRPLSPSTQPVPPSPVMPPGTPSIQPVSISFIFAFLHLH